MAGRLIANGSANSSTVASPSANRHAIERRVGSDSYTLPPGRYTVRFLFGGYNHHHRRTRVADDHPLTSNDDSAAEQRAHIYVSCTPATNDLMFFGVTEGAWTMTLTSTPRSVHLTSQPWFDVTKTCTPGLI